MAAVIYMSTETFCDVAFNNWILEKLGIKKLKFWVFFEILSARFQLENWSAPARLDSTRLGTFIARARSSQKIPARTHLYPFDSLEWLEMWWYYIWNSIGKEDGVVRNCEMLENRILWTFSALLLKYSRVRRKVV